MRTCVVLAGVVLSLIVFPQVHGEEDTIVAQVNGQALRMSELTRRVLADYGKAILDQIINESIVAQEAEKLGIRISEEEVDAELKTYISRLPIGTALDTSLKEQGAGPATLREQLRTALRLRKMVEGKVQPTDKDIADRYATLLTNPDLLQNYDECRVGVIFIKEKTKATRVLQRLQKGDDFAQVARAESEDASAIFGGDVGWRKAPEMDSFRESLKRFGPVEFKFQKGQISSLVKADDGYWIFKITDFRQAKRLTDKDVKSRVRELLVEERILGEMDKKLAELRATAQVVRFPPFDK